MFKMTDDKSGEISSTYNMKFKIELPNYYNGDGQEDLLLWCRRLEVATGVDPKDPEGNKKLAAVLPARLGGTAFSFWDSLDVTTKQNYQLVKDKMKEVFGKRNFISLFQSSVHARPRFHNEPLEVYGAEISKLVNEAFPDYGSNAKKWEKFRRFVAGLDKYLQLKIHESGVTNLEDALTLAARIERAHEASKVAPPLTSNPYLDKTHFDHLWTDDVATCRLQTASSSPEMNLSKSCFNCQKQEGTLASISSNSESIRKIEEAVAKITVQMNTLTNQVKNLEYVIRSSNSNQGSYSNQGNEHLHSHKWQNTRYRDRSQSPRGHDAGRRERSPSPRWRNEGRRDRPPSPRWHGDGGKDRSISPRWQDHAERERVSNFRCSNRYDGSYPQQHMREKYSDGQSKMSYDSQFKNQVNYQ